MLRKNVLDEPAFLSPYELSHRSSDGSVNSPSLSPVASSPVIFCVSHTHQCVSLELGASFLSSYVKLVNGRHFDFFRLIRMPNFLGTCTLICRLNWCSSSDRLLSHATHTFPWSNHIRPTTKISIHLRTILVHTWKLVDIPQFFSEFMLIFQPIYFQTTQKFNRIVSAMWCNLKVTAAAGMN